MSAPTLVSRKFDTGCLTVTAEAPLPLSLADHDISVEDPVCGVTRAFDLGLGTSVDASTLSWLQSSSSPLVEASLVSVSFGLPSSAAVSLPSASGSSASGVSAVSAGGAIPCQGE